MKHRLRNLELHGSNACNLSCHGCSHLSDHGLPGGSISPEDAAAQFALWKDRLDPAQVSIVGGEPLLNRRIIEVVRVAREAFPNARGLLVTNGFFLEDHPGLPQALIDNNFRLDISQHGKKPNYVRLWREKVAPQIWKIRREYPLLKHVVRQSHRGWMSQYKWEDGKPVPYESEPADAHGVCMQRECTQLFNSKLYKCPFLAYFRDFEKKTGAQDVPGWQSFREYKPIEHTASEVDLRDFLANRPVPQCGSCPSQRLHFVHPDPTKRSPR